MNFCSSSAKENLLDAHSPSELKRKSDQVSEKDETKVKMFENITHTNNANIKYVVGKINSHDLYALPNKYMLKTNNVQEAISDDEEKYDRSERKSKDSFEDKDLNKDLPFGWEKHEDNDGPYYWHIKSGTIQREPPLWPKGNDGKELKSPSSSPTTNNNDINKNLNEISQVKLYKI